MLYNLRVGGCNRRTAADRNEKWKSIQMAQGAGDSVRLNAIKWPWPIATNDPGFSTREGAGPVGGGVEACIP
jgi:hypothetical protein